VIPFVEGTRVLEIGHGPGHLQQALHSFRQDARQTLKPVIVGIDESAQMGRLARRNLTSRASSQIYSFHQSGASSGQNTTPKSAINDYTQINLIRGVAQHLPFPNEAFDSIIATFPTEYINETDTLAEIKRCLANQGRLVVLPVALPRNRLLDWLFKVTHQRPTDALEVIQAKLAEPFLAAGLRSEVKTLDVKSGILLVVLATKPDRQ
jgi:ubiquinone/menaquinone biosynthesis C-methylase UbiE